MQITFLSDYGHRDEFVGVCHGVMARIAPQARVIDLLHAVPRHDVRAGALALRRALPHCAPGVHLAVVDPEVGAGRRAIAVRTAGDERLLVGPDNGLLMPVADVFGGVVEAVEITHSPHRLQPVAATFHGRDIFAPVAAHLAAGAPLGDAGAPLEPAELVALDLPQPRIDGATLVVHALSVDGFGNVTLDAGHADLAATGLRVGRRARVACGETQREALVARTFADAPAGQLLLYEDASRSLAMAVNRGDAARELGLAPGEELRIVPLP